MAGISKTEQMINKVTTVEGAKSIGLQGRPYALTGIPLRGVKQFSALSEWLNFQSSDSIRKSVYVYIFNLTDTSGGWATNPFFSPIQTGPNGLQLGPVTFSEDVELDRSNTQSAIWAQKTEDGYRVFFLAVRAFYCGVPPVSEVQATPGGSPYMSPGFKPRGVDDLTLDLDICGVTPNTLGLLSDEVYFNNEVKDTDVPLGDTDWQLAFDLAQSMGVVSVQ